MQTLKLEAHVGKDGVLNLKVPIEMHDQDVDVTIVIEPLQSRTPKTANVTEFKGRLEDSPCFSDDPEVIQRRMRDEWT